MGPGSSTSRARGTVVSAAVLAGCAGLLAACGGSGTPLEAGQSTAAGTSAGVSASVTVVEPALRAPSSAATPAPSAGTRRAPAPRASAAVRTVGSAEWARIVAAGMAHAGCPAGRNDLRRVEVNYWGFDGHVHRGVVVVNRDVAVATAAILTRVFDARFPIRQMRPMEEFAGDDNASMAADNTSAFNCRSAAQANAPSTRSPHANGRAIDINPLENPWRDPRCGCWSPSSRYGVVRRGRGVIVAHGVVWTAFTRAGWIWQDIATADYMHFDTGYPSRPVRSA